MRVLVTGGTGFIGSHTVVALIEAGHEPVVVDNLSNSDETVLGGIGEITGTSPEFHKVDVRDVEAMTTIAGSGVDACIHFAALKAVGESVAHPIKYYENNVGGTIALLNALDSVGVTRFVFSSSATVYGDPETLPMVEDMPIGVATNPYGWTKIMMEQVLQDLYVSNQRWSISLLRYFNPVGAHESSLIGEDPNGVPNNLMPFVAGVASGDLARLQVFGGDYDTPDGTGVRDYIHVVDLAEGHIRALDVHAEQPGVHTYNLGTGKGTSVLELVSAYREVSGREIAYDIVDRRPGDVAASWADVQKAYKHLGWSTKLDLTDMCRDSWNWTRKAPR